MPLPALLAAALPYAIGAGGSIINAAIGSYSASRENALAFQRQKELQVMQQEYNTMMWNKTNEYNTPAHQLQLYRAAGVNPNTAVNAISGVGSASMPATPAVPSVSSTSSPTDALVRGLGSILDYAQRAAQISLTRAQETGQNLSNEGVKLDNERKSIDNDIARIDLKNKPTVYELNFAEQRKRIDEIVSRVGVNDATAHKFAYETAEVMPQVAKLTAAQRDKFVAELQLIPAQLLVLASQSRLNTANVSKVFSDIEVNRSNVDLNSERVLSEASSRLKSLSETELNRARARLTDDQDLHQRFKLWFMKHYGVDLSSGWQQLMWQMSVDDIISSDGSSSMYEEIFKRKDW